MTERPRRRGYRLHAPDSPEAGALLTERGLTRADLDHAIAELARTEGIADPDHRRHQRRRRVRHPPGGLAARPARCLRRAVHPAAVAPGPGAARARAPGQHGQVPRGRHPAGLTGPAYATLRRRGPAARRRSLRSNSSTSAVPHQTV